MALDPPFSTTDLPPLLGSISIAAWIVVFTPQIYSNHLRQSSQGLSLLFIIIWLVGDVFNIVGAVFQGVLPTMVGVAVWYTVADVVLLGQCLWFESRGLWLGGKKGEGEGEEGEETPLLGGGNEEERRGVESGIYSHGSDAITTAGGGGGGGERGSNDDNDAAAVDATHLNPSTPFIPPSEQPTVIPPTATETLKPRSALWAFLFNTSALLAVCLAGALGWYLTSRATYTSRQSPPSYHHHHNHDGQDQTLGYFKSSLLALFSNISSSSQRAGSIIHPAFTQSDNEALHFDLWGQIFGYLCAVLYLGSRIPQLLLNFKRKSTEGVSLLFFLFACLGNLTYVLSIFAYEPGCARAEGAAVVDVDGGSGCQGGEWSDEYGKYILVNTSWLLGSAGTLVLDLLIFGQFWLYRDRALQAAV